jgi:spermidine synthase
VLAAFMGGLAAGSAAGGRLGQRLSSRRALMVYAGLEIAIAVLALLLPYELALTSPALTATYGEGRGALFPWLRLASSVLLVAIPAAAMGATFPVASRWVVRSASNAAADAGTLYAANTVGAAAGAVLAGFVLLPSLGLRGATWIAVALNAAAAAGALALATRLEDDVASASSAKVKPEGPVPQEPRAAKSRRKLRRTDERSLPSGQPALGIAAAALAASGFASLAFQVVWTRLLASILGPTTYAFSTIVAVFIVGIALGAAAGARLVPRSRQPVLGLSLCLAASGVCAALAAASVDRALLDMASTVARPGADFTDVLWRNAVLSCGLLPMTIAFGAAFPFAVAVATRSDASVTADLGLIYAANTLGAILGALLSGFVLIPALGLHGTLRLLTAVVALSGAAIWFLAGAGRRVAAATALAAVLLLAWWLPPWNPLLLSSGVYKYAASLRGPDLFTALTAGELRYYREGATATVAVRQLTGHLSLAIDGKVDASNGGDMLTQRLLAHVPLLLHPAPTRAAIIGLGSGVTLGSALTHPLERAVVLEISPEVVQASAHFERENHHALADPRTALITGDGRTHLLRTAERYDVIVSEPSNPWMAGIASLFTREFFAAARSRLAPGGVVCQWAHTYDISTDDLRSIVATFLSVFPDGTLWLVGDADVLLVGSDGPLTPRIAGMAQAWQRPGVAADLATVGAKEPFAVVSMFVAEGRALADWSAGARLQTDDDAGLEFSGPRSIVGVTRDDNRRALRDVGAAAPRVPFVDQMLTAASSQAWRDAGIMHFDADGYQSAYEAFTRAMERDPDDAQALDGLVRASVPINLVAETRSLLTKLASAPARQAAKIALSRLLAANGSAEESVRIVLGILQNDAGNLAALEQLASVLADVGDASRLAPVVARLRLEAPSSPTTHYYTAALLFLQDRPDQAAREAEATIAIEPGNAKAHNLLGAVLARMGQRDRARQAFTASLRADPREPATYTNLATLELEVGNIAQARQFYAEALSIDPDSAAAREGLSALLRGVP